jgi:hypothetical protein
MTPTATDLRLTRQYGRILLLLVWLFLANASALADTIALDFGSLPSAQGWVYVGDGVPESSVFSVSGGVLRQNSIGLPGRGHEYELRGVVAPGIPFTLDMRARVLREAGVVGIDWGFGFIVDVGTEGLEVGIGTTKIYTQGKGPGSILATGLDNTQFHDYRVTGTLGAGGSFSVFVDGALIGSDVPLRPFSGVDKLGLGDVTGDAMAQAEVTRFVFSQGAAAVPEPSSAVLLASGVLIWRLIRRRGESTEGRKKGHS